MSVIKEKIERVYKILLEDNKLTVWWTDGEKEMTTTFNKMYQRDFIITAKQYGPEAGIKFEIE